MSLYSGPSETSSDITDLQPFPILLRIILYRWSRCGRPVGHYLRFLSSSYSRSSCYSSSSSFSTTISSLSRTVYFLRNCNGSTFPLCFLFLTTSSSVNYKANFIPTRHTLPRQCLPLVGRVVAIKDVPGITHTTLEVNGFLRQLPVNHGGLQEAAEQEVLLWLTCRRLKSQPVVQGT